MIKKKHTKKKGKKRPIKKKLIRKYNTGGMYQPALPASMMPIQNIVYEQTDPNYLDQYEQGLDASAESSRRWRSEALQRNMAQDAQTNQLAGQLTKLGQLDQVQQFGNKATDFVKDLFGKKPGVAAPPAGPLSIGDLQSATGGAPIGPSLANPTAGMDLSIGGGLPGGGAPTGLQGMQTPQVGDYVSQNLGAGSTATGNLAAGAGDAGKSFLGTGKEFAQTKVGGSLTSALKNPMLYTMGAQLIGGAISKAADDNDVTTFTGKEKTGRMLSQAGQWASVGSALGPLGTLAGGIGGAIYGAASGKKQARIARAQQAEQRKQRGTALQNYAMASGNMKEYSGYDLGMGYQRMGGPRMYQFGGSVAPQAMMPPQQGMMPQQPMFNQQQGMPQYMQMMGGPKMYAGGGFDFNVNQERKRLQDYDAPGGTADQYQKAANTSWSDTLDNVQTGLTVGGMSPGIGAVADLVNTGISGARTLTNFFGGNMDKAKKHAVNTGVNLMTTVPILGQGVAGGKLANTVMKTSAKQIDKIKDAKNLTQGLKASAVNVVDPFVKSVKGDPLYTAKALGKTLKGEKLAGGNMFTPTPNPTQTVNPLIDSPLLTGPNQPATSGPMPQMGRMGGERLEGGIAKPLPGGATKFIGRSHEQGGIMVDPMTEVEGGETMDKVNFGKGGKKDYFFSSYLKLGGRSFADRHESMVKSGASQTEIDALADMQEKTAGRKKMRLGGEKKLYKKGGYPFYNNDINSPDTAFYTTSHDPDGKRSDSVVYYYYDPNDVNAEQKFTSKEEMEQHMKDTGVSSYFPNRSNNLNQDPSYDFPESPSESQSDMKATSDRETSFQEETGVTPDNPDYFYLFREWDQGNDITELLKTDENESGSDSGTEFSGLYNNINMKDVEPYMEEIRQLTGMEDFDFKNPDHVKALQTRLTGDLDEAGLITGEEGEYIGKEGEKSVNFAGIDGKFGTDTFEALKLMLDNQGPDPLTEEILDTSDLVKPESTVEGCPCEDGSMSEACCAEEEEEKSNVNMDFKKPFPWHKVGTGLAMGLQMLPAIAAMRAKPDYMAPPGEIPKTHLDRVRFDDARAANQRELRGMGRFIEQSGLGPGGIAAKMAAYEKSNQQEAKIGAQEKRQNAAIANQEAGLNQKTNMMNVKNRMYVNEFNTGARAATKDRRLSGLDTLTKNFAGINKDLLAYQSQKELASAVAGNTGVNERFWEIEAAFKKANPNIKPGTPEYNTALTQYTNYQNQQSQQLTANVTNQGENEDPENARFGGERVKLDKFNRRRLSNKRDRMSDDKRSRKSKRLSARALDAMGRGNEEKALKLGNKSKFFSPFRDELDRRYRDQIQDKKSYYSELKKGNQAMFSQLQRSGEKYADYQKRIGNKVENATNTMTTEDQAALRREKMIAKQKKFAQNYNPTQNMLGGYKKNRKQLKRKKQVYG